MDEIVRRGLLRILRSSVTTEVSCYDFVLNFSPFPTAYNLNYIYSGHELLISFCKKNVSTIPGIIRYKFQSEGHAIPEKEFTQNLKEPRPCSYIEFSYVNEILKLSARYLRSKSTFPATSLFSKLHS